MLLSNRTSFLAALEEKCETVVQAAIAFGKDSLPGCMLHSSYCILIEETRVYLSVFYLRTSHKSLSDVLMLLTYELKFKYVNIWWNRRYQKSDDSNKQINF